MQLLLILILILWENIYSKKTSLKKWILNSHTLHPISYYIDYKVTIVLKKNSLTPALILTHNGASYDTQKKIYKKLLKTLKQSKIIRPLDYVALW